MTPPRAITPGTQARSRGFGPWHLPALAVATALSALPVRGQETAMELPVIDQATIITDKRGSQVSAELEFVDEMRRPVKLSQYFEQGRPVILNLGYFGCPSLCGVVAEGLVDGLLGLDLVLGRDFEVVTVSIDPAETPELAREKKNSYLARYTAAGAEEHWHFLTGKEEQIRALAGAVGFGYQWNPFGKQWDHSAGIMILSEHGVLSQVLQGADYPPRTLRLALVEASHGKVGTAWDRILLSCYGYDPAKREYRLLFWTVVRAGGGLTVLALGTMIFFLWRRERRTAVATT